MIDVGGAERTASSQGSFADLHNHVVPGVDDGSGSLEESLEALRDFRQAGVDALIATPHLYLQFLDGPQELAGRMEQLEREFDRLRSAVAGDSSAPSLRFGQEVCAHDAAAIRRVVSDPRVGLGATSFMLIEFGFELEGNPDSVVRAVRDAGRQIVIAHPERYRYPESEDPMDVMRRWRDAGAFLQINLGSLYAEESAYGSEAERLGWQLLDEGIAHIVSSDHHCRQRPQLLHQPIDRAIRDRGGAEQADLLLRINPLRIIQGLAPLEVPGLCTTGAAR